MTNQGRLICRQSDRRYEPPNTAEQTGNKGTIRVLRKPDKLTSYRHRAPRSLVDRFIHPLYRGREDERLVVAWQKTRESLKTS